MINGTDTIGDITLAMDSQFQIYVGGINNIGYLKPSADGRIGYQSLLKKLPQSETNFGRIWRMEGVIQGGYYVALKKIFRFDGQELKTWSTNSMFYPSYSIGNDFFVREKNVGILKLINDSLVLVAGSEIFAQENVSAILPFDNTGRLLFASRNNGLYVYDQKNIILHTSSAHNNFIDNKISCGIITTSQHYVFGTLINGIIETDKNGDLENIINPVDGLQKERILNVYQDNESGIWTSLNTGFSRIELASPITYFNEKNGIKGTVMDVVRHNGVLYIATVNGVYYISNHENPEILPEFNLVGGLDMQSWEFVQAENQLLVATVNGVYEITNTKPQILYQQGTRSIFYQNDSSRIFIGLPEDGLRVLSKKGNNWKEESKPKNIDGKISAMVSSKEGSIWLAAENMGIIQLKYTRDTSNINYVVYDERHGLPSNSRFMPYIIKGKLVVNTDFGLYRLNQNKFIPDSSLGSYFAGGNHPADPIVTAADGKIWVASDRKAGPVVKTDSGTFHWDYIHSLRIPKTDIWSIYPEANGVTWYGTTDGLIRYDSKIQKNYAIPYHALIRKVTIGKDSVVFHGCYLDQDSALSLQQPEFQKPVIDYKLNSIVFEYAAPFFDNPAGNQYRFFLEGYDDDWSSWTSETKKQYTLLEGKYTFKVQAKNIYEHLSEVAAYEFIISPPIYRSALAFTSYFLLFIGLFYGGIRLNSRRLREANLRLQKKIHLATQEIRGQKEEIEKKNQDITSSIRYAQRIQQAILPTDEAIEENFPDSFVFFKPRDIVSGDFYWFGEKDGHLIIAAADCTGHGVPGAFVSMIGNTMLNKVIYEHGYIQPGDILTQLHKEIKVALKQDDEGSGTKDGMDMALCVLNLEKNELIFAGAYNPLYIVRKGAEEVEEVKANKFPVAGFHFKTERLFENKPVKLNKGDNFYIFSDGYADQFGGEENRKFTYKRLRNLLVDIQDKDLNRQHEILQEQMAAWMQHEKQLDDMLIIGIRV